VWSGEQPLGCQEQAQADQDDAGGAFGGFPVAFGDPASEVQAELGGGEGLDTRCR
jgi:hypothetical protein